MVTARLPVQWLTKAPFPVKKWSERDGGYLHRSGTKVKIKWTQTSILSSLRHGPQSNTGSSLFLFVVIVFQVVIIFLFATHDLRFEINPLSPELNPICYLLALLGAHHFLHVSRIRVRLLTFRLLMSYIYGSPILDVSRSHTPTQHSR